MDAALWGGFWQGDVIAPGYRLPAVELSYLRAVRLAGLSLAVAGGDAAQYLHILQTALRQKPDSLWVVRLLGQALAVVAVSGWVMCLAEGQILVAYRGEGQLPAVFQARQLLAGGAEGREMTPLNEVSFKNKGANWLHDLPELALETVQDWQVSWLELSFYEQVDILVRLGRWCCLERGDTLLLEAVQGFLRGHC